MQNNDFIIVDCRDMLPPEPLIRILEAADNLKDGRIIKMIHRHQPHSMLFTKLDERNLIYDISENDDGSVEILIRRK